MSPFGLPSAGYPASARWHVFRLPVSSQSGSALILVLLITALLATIAVSFLSTSRIEMMAAKNFTRQNAAAGLAESATQMAMAKIKEGFTVNGTATNIITTQPGAIWQFTFASGTCSVVATKNPVELFSGTGNAMSNVTANLNNLQNPSSNATLTSNSSNNQWTITGNASERINVFMENVTAIVNGTNQTVGRIAYYVDDEGTKLNLNSATGNRSTLNAAIRPSDFGVLSANYSNIFASIVNGTASSNTSNVTTWSHFFRPEQVGAAINSAGGNFSLEDLPNISAATSSASSTANITHLLTPWGTQRVAINTLSTNATDGTGTASVSSIFESLTGLNATSVNGTYTASNSTDGLTGRGLQNIFGGNFATKYTPIGVKQIAANMLQMRDPNTATVNASFSYQGPLIGSATMNISTHIPQEYLGFAPYPVVSEVSFDVIYVNDGLRIRPHIRCNVELYNPYSINFTASNATLEYFMRGLTWNMTHRIISANQTYTHRYGCYGNWTDSTSSIEYFSNSSARDATLYSQPGKLRENYFMLHNPYGIRSLYIPAFTKKQYQFGGPAWGTFGQAIPANAADTEIISISDVQCAITYVKIVANSSIASGLNGAPNINSNTIRDWVLGADVNRFIPNNGTLSPRGSGPVNFPLNASFVYGPNSASPISTYSYQRLCPLIKTSMAASSNLTDSTRSWTVNASSANQTFGNNSSGSNLTTTNSTEQLNDANANPLYDSGNTIPSDPSYNNLNGNAIYANATQSSDMRVPELPSFSGNYFYTSPADLGLVPTNQRWRRLRMQMQPSSEGSLIPDWAMLDVISFGNSTNPPNAFNRMLPVNINGRFYLPGNATVAPRTIGLKALAKVLELSSNGTIQNPIDPTQSLTLNATEVTRFNGATANATTIATTIANNIANMTWSGNSSWGNSTSNSTIFRRNALKFPANHYILPSEIMEIAGVADSVSQGNYTNSNSHFKWNEGRASALIPAVTTRSSFFTIFAYAQAGSEINGAFVPDSEALTKTLVEVEVDTPATADDPAVYKVKKLYTQPIPMGQ